MKLTEIKSNPNNPRVIKDHKFEKLKKSISEFPKMMELRPMVINEDNIVLGGNMRLKALKDLGYKEVPEEWVKRASDLTEEETRRFIIADNVGFGEHDWEMLANEWNTEELEDWGLEGFPFEEVTELEAEEDDYTEPDNIQVDVVLGDLIEIGEHRLLCGDSTDSDQVAKLMNGEKADYSEILKPYIAQQKATFRNLITWDKGHGQGQNSENTRSYAIADEKCLFAMMGVQGFNNNADNYFEGWEPIRDYLLSERLKAGWDIPTMKRIAGHSDLSRDHWTCKSQWNMPTIEVYKSFQKWCIDNKVEAFKKEYEELKKEYYSTRAYFNNVHDNFNNVWHFDRHKREGNEGGHATPKPIPLCERAIKSSCPDNGLVLDVFLGSGSTMVASHQLKRKCYGMELDPKYCQVIIDRMSKLDPSLEVKINGVVYNKQANE
jgi:DNA modification methylase